MFNALFAIAGCVAVTATADAQTSVYTHLNEESCGPVHVDTEGSATIAARRCQGDGNWMLYHRADDHGDWTGYGRGEAVPADLSYGGYVGNFGSFHTVVEWRRDDAGAAYATIHRYNSVEFDNEGEAVRRSVLIVTALRPDAETQSCHVGYVDASALSGANEIAREMADRLAPGFECGADEIWRITSSLPTIDAAIADRSEAG